MVDSLYDHSAVEEKWQSFWATNQLFQHSEKKGEAVNNPLYLLFAFAYPSGSGLHVGHVESKTALDIIARYNRMQGRDVFFPVGWDAFGLPAENYAIKTGTPPAETTSAAITTFRRQIQRLGISYDWGNELATNHPEYYRWTQWLFAQLYSKGLAYQGTGLVNWCPSCQTVLANEQVVEGACERCGTEVTQKQMKQWYFKITQYRDELISGLDSVDWPEPTKQQQLHWIGKSEGVTYAQKVKDLDLEISAYDSVPQTFMAQTFAVIAPESPLLEQLIIGTEHEEPVKKFVTEFQKRKVQNRFKIDTEVEGIFTGRYVENPFGTGDLPIWVATFVIAEYGSGFVNCSAHDERDFAFAKKYGIPLRPVMFPADESEAKRVRGLEYCYHHAPEGVLESPQEFSGRSWGDARSDMIKYIESKGFGTHSSQYRLRDWLISRQRYWGTPIPVIYDPTGEPHLVEDSALPWTLPTDVDFKPTGESPLVSSKVVQERTEQYAASYCADLIKEKGWDATGAGWRPEYDTMDTFVDSSWYYLRYTDSRNTAEFASAEQLQKWLPVDFYMIGPEHIVLHLLYSRFFTKFLRDQGHLQFGEPFLKMRHQGMILGPDGKKMSKSKGNVINPDEIIEKFGADTLRIYEMFMGPIEADKPWDVRAVVGAYKFLQRVHRQVGKNLEALGASSQVATVASPTDQAVQRKLHQTIQKVTDDIPSLKFNTAIAALMEFLNTWEQSTVSAPLSAEDISACIRITAPFAPFLAEELWDNWSKQYSVAVAGIQSVHLSSWPSWDTELAQEEFATLAVQINGKVRAELRVSQAQLADEVAILAQAQALPELQKYLAGAQIKKTIYVPGKILSIVLNT